MAESLDHAALIQRCGGVTPLRKMLAGAGHDLPDPTIRSWARMNSIPAPYWVILTGLDFATLDELARAVAKPDTVTGTAGVRDGEAVMPEPMAGAK